MPGSWRRCSSTPPSRGSRISSLEPWTVEDGLIALVADEPRICKHLHLPLQHGSDAILRGHGQAVHGRLLPVPPGNRIGLALEDIAMGADVIVGFPGEDGSTVRREPFLHQGYQGSVSPCVPPSRQGPAPRPLAWTDDRVMRR
ncbi:MAG: hypothetical protein MZV70_37175 [Desulfobacterales bacterium]|nr:hypothetical protein [Desulfobacterales bacterium]